MPPRILVNLLVSIWLALNAFDGIQMTSDDAYAPRPRAVVSLTNVDSTDDIRNYHGVPVGIVASSAHCSYDNRLVPSDVPALSSPQRELPRSYLLNCALLL